MDIEIDIYRLINDWSLNYCTDIIDFYCWLYITITKLNYDHKIHLIVTQII